MHPLGKAATGVGLIGAAVAAYSAGYEVRAYRLRRIEIACLPPDAERLRVLHLSDIHLTPGQAGKVGWLRSLAALEPDVVINTGDNLSHADSVPVLMDALDGLRGVPGAYVLGSNDYWGPVPKNPLRYLLPNGGGKKGTGPPPPLRG